MINKKALNLFFAFCIVIVICIFLSSTLKNVTTPRVVAGYAWNGFLEKETFAEGYIDSQKTEIINFDVALEYPFTIETVNVKTGDIVNAGDIIFKSSAIPQSLADDLKSAEDDYNYYLEKLLLEQAKAGVSNINFDSDSFLAYQEALSLQQKLLKLELSLVTEADKLELTDSTMTYLEKLEYLISHKPNQLADKILIICEKQNTADDALELMKEKFDKTNGKGIYEYSQIMDAQRRLLASEYTLYTIQQKINMIENMTSPVSGIAAEVYIAEGEEYTGKSAVMIIENELPCVRFVINDNQNEDDLIRSSYTVSYNNKDYKAKFSHYDSDDGSILLTFANDEILSNLSVISLYGKKVSITIKTNAGQGKLVPMEALQGYTGEQTVYLLEEEKGFWGVEWKTKAVEVNVIDFNSQVALVEGNINVNQQIIVGWDRPIFGGQTVLPFNN